MTDFTQFGETMGRNETVGGVEATDERKSEDREGEDHRPV
jgi:hypothetical protein